MALHQLVYVSLANHAMALDELAALVVHARTRNAHRGITGALLYHRQEFMQLMEGEETEVRALFAAICNDPRHQQIHVMWEGPLAERNFSSWDMALVAPTDADLQQRSGYEQLLDKGLIASSRDSIGKKFLLQVREDFLNSA